MMKRILISIAALTLLACSSASAAQTIKVTWGYLGLTAMNWDVYAAIDQGYMADEDLEVAGVRFDAGPTTVQALLNNSVDILTTNTEFLMSAIGKGAPISIVASEVSGTGFVLVAQPRIKTFQDLRGATVGTGQLTGGATTMLRLLMEHHGLSSGDYSLLALGGSTNRFAALSRNAAAAVLLNPPFDEQAKGLGMVPLGKISEVFNGPLQVFAVHRGWSEKHEDTVVRFLRATIKASRWLHDPRNHEAAIRVLAKALNSDPAKLESVYQTFVGPENLLGSDLKLEPEAIQAFLSILDVKADPTRYIDLTFLQKASGQ